MMPNQRLCALVLSAALAVSTQVSAATFHDSFSSGLNPTYWTVTQTATSPYAWSTPSGQVLLERKPGFAGGGLQLVAVSLNLSALGGSIAGNFSTSINFNSAVLGSHLDQVQLETYFANGSYFHDVHDNDGGTINNHVWNAAALRGKVPNTDDHGTFTISREGSVVSGYFNSTLLYSTNISSALTGIRFTLQNNQGNNDLISAKYDEFFLTAATVPAPIPEPETYALMLAGLGLLSFAARRRNQSTSA